MFFFNISFFSFMIWCAATTIWNITEINCLVLIWNWCFFTYFTLWCTVKFTAAFRYRFNKWKILKIKLDWVVFTTKRFTYFSFWNIIASVTDLAVTFALEVVTNAISRVYFKHLLHSPPFYTLQKKRKIWGMRNYIKRSKKRPESHLAKLTNLLNILREEWQGGGTGN